MKRRVLILAAALLVIAAGYVAHAVLTTEVMP